MKQHNEKMFSFGDQTLYSMYKLDKSNIELAFVPLVLIWWHSENGYFGGQSMISIIGPNI
jgi:hypothetical protein